MRMDCSLLVPLSLAATFEDAVGVNVEGHLNLGHAAWSRGDAVEVEAAEGAVVVGKLALALQHVDLHRRLVVRGRGKDLALLGGE